MGHGAALGGAIVDGGHFDWMAHADNSQVCVHLMNLIMELHMQRNLAWVVLLSQSVHLS